MTSHRNQSTHLRADHHDGHTHRAAHDDESEETFIGRRVAEGLARRDGAGDTPAERDAGYAAHRYERMSHEYVGWSLYESDDPRAFDGEHAPYAAWGASAAPDAGRSNDANYGREETRTRNAR